MRGEHPLIRAVRYVTGRGGGGLVGGKVGLLFRGRWAGWGNRVKGGGEGKVLHLEENNPVQQ